MGPSHSDPRGRVAFDASIGPDAAGRITSIASTRTGTDYYTYDKTNQLLSDGVNIYTWDVNGNPEGSQYTIGTGNRLESDGTWKYLYDDEGNLIKKTSIANREEWS